LPTSFDGGNLPPKGGLKMALRKTCLSVLGLAVLAAMVSLSRAGAARPAEIVCGSEISVNTRLQSDLKCSGNGLSVDAGVTLNLAGHTVQGSGTGTGITVNGGVGTLVTNGTVSGFGVGMFPDLAQVTRVRITKNASAGVIVPADGGCLSMADSAVINNGGIGVSAAGPCLGQTIQHTVVSGNDGIGIEIQGQADLALISNNRVWGNSGDGIHVDSSTTSFINNAVINNGGDGIHVFEDFPPPIAQGYFFAGNVADHNGDYGIEVVLVYTNQQVTDGGGNIARHNANPAQCFNIQCITSDQAAPSVYSGNLNPHPTMHPRP
jgi:hypothetical protein